MYKIIKDFCGFKSGQKVLFNHDSAKRLIKKGLIEPIEEDKEVKTKIDKAVEERETKPEVTEAPKKKRGRPKKSK